MPKPKYFLEKNLDKLRQPAPLGVSGKRNGRRHEDLKTQKFGELTVLEFMGLHLSLSYGAVWKCECVCGNICYVSTWEIKKRRQRCSFNHGKSDSLNTPLEKAQKEIHKKGRSIRFKVLPNQVEKLIRMERITPSLPKMIIEDQKEYINELKEAATTFFALGKNGSLEEIKESRSLLHTLSMTKRSINRFLEKKGIKL